MSSVYRKKTCTVIGQGK